VAELLMKRTCKHGVLKVFYGDLSKHEADIIATPSDNRLSGREGIDAKVYDVAGEELREACKEISVKQRKLNLPPCPVSTTKFNKPYNLSCKYLLHVVSPDCRRPAQDQNRRDLLPKTYSAMFTAIQGKKEIKSVAAAPFSMDIFSYPHREGAKMTFSLLLEWLDSEECNIEEYHMIVLNKNFIDAMRTVYRETEDQLPGRDTTDE
tara:strand:- start:6909 stop:7526 length:618 start_codon:yes stop_codon:yes gene_type:complete